MPSLLRTTLVVAALFGGLLAPAAVASADALPLTPAQQPAEPVAAPNTTGTGSVNTGATGSFDASPTGSSNVIKALQTGSGQCRPGLGIPTTFDGSAAPWCGLYH
ncbi:hypothetical protein [Nocardia seriolae]|uniref:Uncharacterized protein n=1 Tax=Nocardia seriolae TaxID=37332 RepID=A0ABC9YWB0_9NOCA|nr:hypothetical protein [Nocardia seriolae]BEK98706.1 hypothetical protein NSER024013_66120 [Nocardia seriolae]GAM47383.1 hypothetical protein NS07_v2contig00049-0010 [Nocardia seriolae]GAP29321.1 hypothetical protein NSK11_contig00053-0040 [Nocardia seriolae]